MYCFLEVELAEWWLVGFQALELSSAFLFCRLELSHLCLEGLGLAFRADTVFCGQSLIVGVCLYVHVCVWVFLTLKLCPAVGQKSI